MPTTLTTDDIEDLHDQALDAGDPTRIVGHLVAAVDDGRLVDPDDAALALAYAAELLSLSERPAEALRLAVRAVDASPASNPYFGFTRATHSDLLFALDRPDEAIAVLDALRPLHMTDRETIRLVVDVLIDAERLDIAHTWLTEAAADQKAHMAAFPEGDESDESVDRLDVLYALISLRHDIREELGLEHDADDELADHLHDVLENGLNDTLLFWPRDEHAQLTSRWPELAELVGTDWDTHRAIIERVLVEHDETGDVPILVAGSVDGLLAYAEKDGVEPGSADAQIGYAQTVEPSFVEWPPPRNAPCWCGSGDKYKKCCLPRSRRDT